MKLPKSFYVCRQDETCTLKAAFATVGSPDADHCWQYENGKCAGDNKKCKVVKYERVDNFVEKSK